VNAALRAIAWARRLRRPFVAAPPPGSYRRAVASQSVRGTIGTVRDLQGQVEAAMREHGLSWAAVARKVGRSRQYLRKTMAEPAIPADLLEALTRVLGLQPTIRLTTDLAPYLVHPEPNEDVHESTPPAFL
jgi:hypothetical protein